MEKDKVLRFLENSVNKKVIESVLEENLAWIIRFEDDSDFYVFCSWRLAKENEVLALFLDCLVPVGIERIEQNIKHIEGKSLRSIEVSDFYDLVLHFDEGYCVEIFCDASYYGTEDGRNYCANWDYDNPSLNKWLRITNFFEAHWEDMD